MERLARLHYLPLRQGKYIGDMIEIHKVMKDSEIIEHGFFFPYNTRMDLIKRCQSCI